MKKSILSFFLFGAILSAAPVNVTFVDAGNPLKVVNNIYVGPYDLNVNGKAVQAMCMDDFRTVGGNWQANVTAVNGTDFSKTYVGNSKTFDIPGYGNLTIGAKDLYQAEAYLFSNIIKPNADRADIQEAAWAIMDPNTLANVFTSNNTAVKNILFDTYNNYSNFDASGYEILSDISNSSPNQEFMMGPTATPEPASFALLGGGLFAAGAARLFRRKKQTEVKA